MINQKCCSVACDLKPMKNFHRCVERDIVISINSIFYYTGISTIVLAGSSKNRSPCNIYFKIKTFYVPILFLYYISNNSRESSETESSVKQLRIICSEKRNTILGYLFSNWNIYIFYADLSLRSMHCPRLRI